MYPYPSILSASSSRSTISWLCPLMTSLGHRTACAARLSTSSTSSPRTISLMGMRAVMKAELFDAITRGFARRSLRILHALHSFAWWVKHVRGNRRAQVLHLVNELHRGHKPLFNFAGARRMLQFAVIRYIRNKLVPKYTYYKFFFAFICILYCIRFRWHW